MAIAQEKRDLMKHAVEQFRLLPHAHLAVLPNTDHFMRLMNPE